MKAHYLRKDIFYAFVWGFIFGFIVGLALSLVAQIIAHGLTYFAPRLIALYNKISEGLPVFLFALLAATVGGAIVARIEFKDQRRTIRRSTGFCEDCGYDLRNLPDHRCPECGMGFKKRVRK
jgi:hypothetical protein